MNIVTCPGCGVRVLLAPGTRRCPSCRRLVPASADAPALKDAPASEQAPAATAFPSAAADSVLLEPVAGRAKLSLFADVAYDRGRPDFREASGLLNPYQPPKSAAAVRLRGAGQPVWWLVLLRFLFSFEGRASRSYFWLGVIGSRVGVFLLAIPVELYLPSDGLARQLILILLGIVGVWILLALSVKRWHDRDKSGLWVLVVFLPLVGIWWFVIEAGFLPGTEGDNEYGPDPRLRWMSSRPEFKPD